MGYAKLIKNYSPEIIQLTQTNYNQLDTSVKNNGNIYITTDTHQLYQNSQGFIPGVATAAANGLMSSADKTKLNGIATGAEVNQNAFSNIAIGSSTIAADTKTDTLTLTAGNNITLTPNTSTDTVTIAVSGASSVGNNSNVPTGAAVQSYVTGLGYTKNTGTVTKVNTGAGLVGGGFSTTGTISLASGVITAKTVGPTAAVTGNEGVTIAIPSITVDTYGRVTGLTSYNLTNKNTTYSVATTRADGLMSAADKVILNNLNSEKADGEATRSNHPLLKNATFYNAGQSGSTFRVWKKGNVATLIIDFTDSSSQVTWQNVSSYSGYTDAGYGHLLAQLPNGFYPRQRVAANITPNFLPSAVGKQMPMISLTTNGGIYLCTYYGASFHGGRTIVTYII